MLHVIASTKTINTEFASCSRCLDIKVFISQGRLDLELTSRFNALFWDSIRCVLTLPIQDERHEHETKHAQRQDTYQLWIFVQRQEKTMQFYQIFDEIVATNSCSQDRYVRDHPFLIRIEIGMATWPPARKNRERWKSTTSQKILSLPSKTKAKILDALFRRSAKSFEMRARDNLDAKTTAISLESQRRCMHLDQKRSQRAAGRARPFETIQKPNDNPQSIQS